MINVLGARRDKHARTICESFSIIDRATRELFDCDLRQERQREIKEEKEERGNKKKKKERVRSIASFVDNRTVTERQVLE